MRGPKPVPIACGHVQGLLRADTYQKVINYCIKYLKPHAHEFDAIAVSGYSMALVGSTIAFKMKKNLVLVRKPSESRYSPLDAEGITGQKIVFIDDCIASGSTFKRVADKITELDCKVVGYITYLDREISTVKVVESTIFWGEE